MVPIAGIVAVPTTSRRADFSPLLTVTLSPRRTWSAAIVVAPRTTWFGASKPCPERSGGCTVAPGLPPSTGTTCPSIFREPKYTPADPAT